MGTLVAVGVTLKWLHSEPTAHSRHATHGDGATDDEHAMDDEHDIDGNRAIQGDDIPQIVPPVHTELAGEQQKAENAGVKRGWLRPVAAWLTALAGMVAIVPTVWWAGSTWLVDGGIVRLSVVSVVLCLPVAVVVGWVAKAGRTGVAAFFGLLSLWVGGSIAEVMATFAVGDRLAVAVVVWIQIGAAVAGIGLFGARYLLSRGADN